MLDEYGLELQPWSSFKNTNYLIVSFRGRADSYWAGRTCADATYTNLQPWILKKTTTSVRDILRPWEWRRLRPLCCWCKGEHFFSCTCMYWAILRYFGNSKVKNNNKKKRLIPAICWFYDKVCQESPKLLLSVLMWGVSAVLLYWLTACSGFASGWQNFTSRLKTRKKKHLHDPPQLVAPPPSPTVCGYHFISVRWW